MSKKDRKAYMQATKKEYSEKLLDNLKSTASIAGEASATFRKEKETMILTVTAMGTYKIKTEKIRRAGYFYHNTVSERGYTETGTKEELLEWIEVPKNARLFVRIPRDAIGEASFPVRKGETDPRTREDFKNEIIKYFVRVGHAKISTLGGHLYQDFDRNIRPVIGDEYNEKDQERVNEIESILKEFEEEEFIEITPNEKRGIERKYRLITKDSDEDD